MAGILCSFNLWIFEHWLSRVADIVSGRNAGAQYVIFSSSSEYDIQGCNAKGQPGQKFRGTWEYPAGWRWSSCVVHPLQAIVPKQQNIHQTGAARLELRVWEIISEGHILKLGETLGKKRGMKRMPRRNPSRKLRPLQRLMIPSATWWCQSRVADVEVPQYWRCTTSQVLLQKEGPSTYAILSRNLLRFTRFRRAFRELWESFCKACFQRAFGELS